MNGRVIPVIGSSATTTPMLMNAWRQSQAVMPAARSAPNVSGAASATRTPEYASSRKSVMTTIAPIIPNSCPISAKMKSLNAFGTNTRLPPRPVPTSPPTPRASRPWTV